jgi:hypothetical protein
VNVAQVDAVGNCFGFLDQTFPFVGGGTQFTENLVHEGFITAAPGNVIPRHRPSMSTRFDQRQFIPAEPLFNRAERLSATSSQAWALQLLTGGAVSALNHAKW